MRNRVNLRPILLALAMAIPLGASGNGFDDMYVVGDSLSDQGNLFYATEILTGSGIPAADHYWQGRFANGKVYAAKLAESMGLTLSRSEDGGNNFANGGARTDYNIVEVDFDAHGNPV